MPDRRLWRDPGYWRWWWRERVNAETKTALAFVAAVLLVVAGVTTADSLSSEHLPGARTVTSPAGSASGDGSEDGDTAPLTPPSATRAQVTKEGQSEMESTSGPPEQSVVTVRRGGGTRVVRKVVRTPGQTVTLESTVPGAVRERVVTDARTETLVRTETETQTQTATHTQTQTATHTQTETRTQVQTTERLVTVTTPGTTETVLRTVTETSPPVTETATVTVHEPAIVVTVTRPAKP